MFKIKSCIINVCIKKFLQVYFSILSFKLAIFFMYVNFILISDIIGLIGTFLDLLERSTSYTGSF